MIDIRYTYPNNSIIGYLKTNLLRYEIISLCEIIDVALLNIFCIDTNKLGKSSIDLQF